MDGFVYQCKKQKMKVQNEVPFPELAVAIIQKLSWQVEKTEQRAQKTYADIETVL